MAPPTPQIRSCFDGVLIEIIAGEGGLDAENFGRELAKAYYAFNSRKGWALVENETTARKLSFIAPPQACSFFANEVGQHCVQRVPPSERGGRRHTSLVSVLASPIPKPKPVTHILDGVEIITQRGRGPGGQNQNKVASGVRASLNGESVFINGRSQLYNKDLALRILEERLRRKTSQAQLDQAAALRSQQYSGGGRGVKIRTYNYIDNRVTDHRNNVKIYQVYRVLGEGRFELLTNPN